jgi:Secretion system C-terminal sorting domain
MKAVIATKFFVFIFFFTSQSQSMLVAPEVINTSGGTYHTGNYIFEWSIGELPMVQTFSEDGLMVSCGFLQTSLKKSPSNPPNVESIELNVYPNPVMDIVNLQFKGLSGAVQIMLVDAAGKVLQKQSISNAGNHHVDMSRYSNGNYFLIINGMQKNAQPYFKTHKLVKL